MIRRQLLDEEQKWFATDLVVGEDIDLWFRLARRAKIGFIDEGLAYYRQRADSLVHDNIKQLLGAIAAHTANLDRGKSVFSNSEVYVLKDRIARRYFNLGYAFYLGKSMLEARESYLKCREFNADRFSLFSYIKTFIPVYMINWIKKPVPRDD